MLIGSPFYRSHFVHYIQVNTDYVTNVIKGKTKCVEPFCNKIEITNAEVTCLDDVAQLGSMCSIKCDDGYRVKPANKWARIHKNQMATV